MSNPAGESGGTNANDDIDDMGDIDAERAPAQVRRLRPTSKRTSGRERHEEKITVYVSSEELFALERARLVLRAEHGIAVDRGRMVRESVAELLLDLDARGEESMLVRRLRS